LHTTEHVDLQQEVPPAVSGPPGTPTVLIVSGSIGAGHNGAAAELAARLRERHITVEIRDYLRALPRPIAAVLRRGYPASIRFRPGVLEWLFTSAERATWMAILLNGMCWLARRRVRAWASDASLVVSTFPFASQTLGQLAQAGVLRVPTVTYLTDPAPHRLWLHSAVEHHLTVTPATAAVGLRDYQVRMRPVGALVGAAFSHRHTRQDRARLRLSLGLSATEPVVLIVAGSEGMGDIPSTVDALAAADIAEIVVLCGRNERLRRRFDGSPRVLALGWRTDVPDLMAAADVLVHNAGGLSLTEALAAGLPAVTYRPIPGHGVANARVLEESGLVPWPKDVPGLVAEVLRQHRAGRRPPRPRLGPDACGFVTGLLAASDRTVTDQVVNG
jgi:UDP-N-acetylglucosamine:LPS N-acetylglucosamine transferase